RLPSGAGVEKHGRPGPHRAGNNAPRRARRNSMARSRTMSDRRPLVSLVFVCLIAGAARGQDLAARLAAVIDAPEYRHGRWGLLVVEADGGRVVYERNADQLFLPASTTKLYSCSSALHHLGPDYRLETPVYRRGPGDNGTLHRD